MAKGTNMRKEVKKAPKVKKMSVIGRATGGRMK